MYNNDNDNDDDNKRLRRRKDTNYYLQRKAKNAMRYYPFYFYFLNKQN